MFFDPKPSPRYNHPYSPRGESEDSDIILIDLQTWRPMETIAIRIDPQMLDNPNADIRYKLPDLLAERSGGTIDSDGYDYAGDSNLMLLFLKASDLKAAVACILDVIEKVRLFGNDLRKSVVVAIERDGGHDVIFPPDFEGPFLPAQAPPH